MEYRVLARKYRPASFADLIGQDVLVRTLSNAIKSGRIAHAFLLTGIRGVGKTTTARIIARALNCIGPDGQGGPTISPCGVCTHCRMVAEDRHVDVLEMDAASHTGVSDIRELIDTVRYLPGAARYKVYIIDEVHMLSASAFNALLKTLEEPPPHVKFIFATTEARKIPVTILSRCQRFDLKRVELETLQVHLGRIAEKEGLQIEADALRLIAIAAEGSVRDALSLLDQAIAQGTENGVEGVRRMLGLSDRSQTATLLETLFAGDVSGSLCLFKSLYEAGADPLLVVQDCLEFVHFITRLKLVPDLAKDASFAEEERKRAAILAGKLSTPVLTRAWQLLLKGAGEVRLAGMPAAAAEMVFVRVAHAADLPLPADIVRNLEQNGTSSPSGPGGGRQARVSESTSAVAAARPVQTGNLAVSREPVAVGASVQRPHLALVTDTQSVAQLSNFAEAVELFLRQREMVLHSYLTQSCRLVAFTPGHIELQASGDLPRDFTTKAAQCLQRWTGSRWSVALSDRQGEPTLHEQQRQRKEKQIADAAIHPLVAGVLAQFPGAEVTDILEDVEGQ